MRLIYIAPMLQPVGGLERTLTDKANYIVSKGHEVMLLTYQQKNEKIYYPLDKRVILHDMDCPVYSLYRLPLYARIGAYRQLRRQFRQRMRQILDNFCPDVVVITVPNTEDYINDMMGVAQNVKVVVESHLALPFHMVGKPFTERLLCWLYPPVRAIRKANLLITLTEQDARNWRQRGVRSVMVVPNPLTSYDEDIVSSEKSGRRIIAVGRLFGQKRFDRLVEAFALIASKYPAWSVDIFGEGPLRAQLQEQIGLLGLSGRVRLLPPTHAIYVEYRRSQFFVLSSDYEGFGMVIIEAMACGLPVVSTNCPCGPSEIVEEGKTGLLASMEVQDLADKMEWMITHEDERQQMGGNAHEAAARYRMENVMQEWLQAYGSVLS